MDNLERAVGRRNKEWKELELTIIALMKEHFRLLGKPYYESVPAELESAIMGEG